MRIRVLPGAPEKTASAKFEFRFKPEEVEALLNHLSPKGYSTSPSTAVWEFRGRLEIETEPNLEPDGTAAVSVSVTLL